MLSLVGPHFRFSSQGFEQLLKPSALVNPIPVVRETFVDWVLAVSQLNEGQGIPYGFDPYSASDFLPTGEYAYQGTGRGLTCATFVISCLARYGINLIDPNTWTIDRPRDAEFQAWAIQELPLKRGADAAHVAAQQELVSRVARFRPGEVAPAAGLFLGAPVSFDEACAGAADILEQMTATGLC